jgi:hypothetical protein
MLKAGIAEYDYCLSRKPEHVAWYQKEIALYWQHHLDTDFYAFNMDRELDPHFKEAWCKRSSPKLLRKFNCTVLALDFLLILGSELRASKASGSVGSGH